MTVFLSVGKFRVAVTGIVTALAPHLNVITPPLETAEFKAANVQLEAVPFPTTVVGLEIFAARAELGTPVEHEVGIDGLTATMFPPGTVEDADACP